MSKLKTFEVYKSGSVKIKEIKATSVTRACEQFELTLKRTAVHKIINRDYATIRYADSTRIYNDFVIMLK